MPSQFPPETYVGKTVEFLFEVNGRLLLLTGEFAAITGAAEAVCIHYTGRLHANDHPASEYLFQLTQAHLRSTRPATRPAARVDFLMEQPLIAYDCMSTGQGAAVSVPPVFA